MVCFWGMGMLLNLIVVIKAHKCTDIDEVHVAFNGAGSSVVSSI